MKYILICLFAVSSVFGGDHAMVSIYAVRDTGEVLMDTNSDLSLVPASCMKVVTTAAALTILGVDYRFETHLEYSGTIDATKTLQGNVYVRGGGDPCLGSDLKQLEIWAEAIENLGIKRIQGNVIGDATKWEKALAPPGWFWEDLGNYYGAGACALSFHENMYKLVFKPADTVGDDAIIIRTEPYIPLCTLRNEVKTGPSSSLGCACIYGSEYSNVQYVRGTIPCGVAEFFIRGAISDPAATCASLLVAELQKRGIEVEKQEFPVGQRVVFHTTYSPTVGEIVYWTNQKSSNLYAEHLLKAVGGGSTSAGVKVVTDFWKNQGVDLDGFHMSDGSGLSRTNLVSTKQLVDILLKIKKSALFPVFFESLPLRDRGIKSKSGSMFLIKGYVGYIGDSTFALLVNQCPDSQVMNATINKLLENLSEESMK